jgi:hypothetical protein
VVPQPPELGSKPFKADIKAPPSLRAEVGPLQIKEGTVDACQADFVARFTSRWPLPRRAEICASVTEEGAEPFKIVIPIAIWPSRLSILAWVLTGVVLVVLSARYLEEVRSATPIEAARAVLQDLSFLYQAALIGVGVAFLVYVVGWLAVSAGLIPGDAE